MILYGLGVEKCHKRIRNEKEQILIRFEYTSNIIEMIQQQLIW